MTDNAAQAKHAIDSGATGDKVPGFDPAAAPLGTDDEAGGAGPAPVDASDGPGHKTPPNAAHPPLAPDAERPATPMGWPLAIGVGAAVALGAVLLLAL